MAVRPVPEGYHSVTPYLTVRNADRAIEFYKAAFGATELMRINTPDGKVGHAEVKIGDSPVMLAEENPAWGNRGPESLGGSSVGLCIYVPDCDAVFAQATAAGAAVTRPVADQFYGDRSGTVTDPFGHVWTLATHVEDVPADELQRRMDALMKSAEAA